VASAVLRALQARRPAAAAAPAGAAPAAALLPWAASISSSEPLAEGGSVVAHTVIPDAAVERLARAERPLRALVVGHSTGAALAHVRAALWDAGPPVLWVLDQALGGEARAAAHGPDALAAALLQRLGAAVDGDVGALQRRLEGVGARLSQWLYERDPDELTGLAAAMALWPRMWDEGVVTAQRTAPRGAGPSAPHRLAYRGEPWRHSALAARLQSARDRWQRTTGRGFINAPAQSQGR
jgi:hypothetical protein